MQHGVLVMLLSTHYVMMAGASQPSNGRYITHEMETQAVCPGPL